MENWFKMSDYERLQSLVGKEIDYDDIYYCLIDEEKDIVISYDGDCPIYNNINNQTCVLIQVYYDDINSTIYEVCINEDKIIVDVL